jgi:NAD(P)-dependent dehydrogenase (short-subunit alcohol dehydrogenase family)
MAFDSARIFDLSGQVALVTGGSRGLGREIALAFARAGADVAITSRKVEACREVALEVEAIGRRAMAWPCHIGHWDEIELLADAVYERFGKITILVNNAGMSPLAPSLAETDETLFDKVVGVNFKGPFRLAALIGERMAAGDGGSIINVSCTGAIRPEPRFAIYAGAKAALNALSTALAFAYGPKVRVNTISPGQFLTDIAKSWPPAMRNRTNGAIPRCGLPEEIVSTALYLASPASSYTTGAIIRVDGGLP